MPKRRADAATPGPYPNRLAAVRRRAGLTQDELAERSGMGRGYVQKLESGKVWLSADKLAALAAALDCGRWELMPDAPDLGPDDLRFIAALRRFGPEGHRKLFEFLQTMLPAAEDVPPQ